MSDDEIPYFTYWDNLYNEYVGKRVRLVIRNRCKRQKVFIGTFKAYDLHVNVVLADVYRVILNSTEEQRQDVNGLLLVRGTNVSSITCEEKELHLAKWPTKPKKTGKKKAAKSPVRAQTDKPEATTPTTPSKPVRLKRNWLTTPSPGGSGSAPWPSPQTPEPTGERSNTATPVGSVSVTAKEKGDELGKGESEEIPVEIKQEVKEESTTFEEFLLSRSEQEEIEGVVTETVKSEPQGSPASDMPTS